MDDELKKSILKTGTSLVGIVCKDGVVLGSDNKVTLGGQIVADKNFIKTYKINDYLAVSIAGTLSDAQISLRMIASQLKLKELKDKKRPSIKEAASFIAAMKFQNIRQPSMIPSIVGNLVAGVNEDGSVELYEISPDGANKKIEDYGTSGSGMPYILGLLERSYRKDLSVEEGVALAVEAIKAASERDTASGCGIDVFTITKDGITHVSNQKVENVYKECN